MRKRPHPASVPAAAAFAATLAGCVLVSTSITLPPEADSGPRPDPVDSGTANGADAVRMVLANLGQSVVLAAYRDADRSAAALEAATSAHAAAPTEATAEEARQAWRQAMIAWQAAELFTLGPAGEMGMGGVAGGRDLRSHIYSWPLSNPCRVDQEIGDPLVGRRDDDGSTFTTVTDDRHDLVDLGTVGDRAAAELHHDHGPDLSGRRRTRAVSMHASRPRCASDCTALNRVIRSPNAVRRSVRKKARNPAESMRN